jgi:hypothetical protein
MDARDEGAMRGTATRRSCLVEGCTCSDPRIVSRRRAAFFAALARTAGETADRVIAVEPGWRIPAATGPAAG